MVCLILNKIEEKEEKELIILIKRRLEDKELEELHILNKNLDKKSWKELRLVSCRL